MRRAVATARAVIIVDNNGSHPAMTIAEFVAEQADEMELVTPDRGLAPDIGSTNFPAYMRAMNAPNVKVTLNLQIERLERRGNRIRRSQLQNACFVPLIGRHGWQEGNG